MTTKQRPERVVPYKYVYNGKSWRTQDVHFGSDSITYEDGMKRNGRWPWKACEHISYSTGQPIMGFAQHIFTGQWEHLADDAAYWLNTNTPSMPAAQFDESVLQQIYDQINLGTGESTLLYSGVIQAVPLLGSVFKLNRIMKDVARHISKTMRRKPFTTVVKDLIQADLINRFVIKPTLDDARRFQTATDYVINVINTAQERNAAPFALESTSTDVTEDRTVDWGQWMISGGLGASATGHWRYHTRTTSKAFALLSARYDIGAISPLKLWAHRVGLTRPLDSVWDLVPFSFVVDYFTRAGDFISALSDEMSQQQGLRGTITEIHDIWCTTNAKRSVTGTCTGFVGGSYFDRYASEIIRVPGSSERASCTFRRFRLPNPYGALIPALTRSEDYLQVTLLPSTTRLRTIAELIIQAKL